MNGIASLSRIITIGAPFFSLVQRSHWVAMLGWGVFTVGFLIKPKEWMRVIGLTAGVLELVVGIPLAIITAQELGRFSLFSLAPIACLILVVLLVWPGMWEKIVFENGKEQVAEISSVPQTA
jgi:exosortase/archaeosortase